MKDNVKIKIKIGILELKYEGKFGFLDKKLEDLLDKMKEVSARVPTGTMSPEDDLPPLLAKYDFSIDTIASRCDVKKGPELIICAMAYLEFVEQKNSSINTEIRAVMKEATGYCNDSMLNNFSAHIKSLVKNKRINRNSSGGYSLSAKEKKEIESKIKIADIK